MHWPRHGKSHFEKLLGGRAPLGPGKRIALAFLIEEGIDHDSRKPGMQRRHPFELMDRPVSIEHHFLREVLCVVMIAAIFQSQGVETPLVTGGKLAKCLHIPVLGSGNQFRLFGR